MIQIIKFHLGQSSIIILWETWLLILNNMSRIFYDHLTNFAKIEKLIKTSATSADEKEELWKIVDEIVHHKVMGCILWRSEEHTSELQSHSDLVCRLLLEKKKQLARGLTQASKMV